MAAVDTATISVSCSGPGSIPLLGKTKISVAQITSGNIVAQKAAVAALAAAEQGLTLGVVKSTSIAIDSSISVAYPSTPANRGSKWVVNATNAALQPYTHTIPAGNTSGTNANVDGNTANIAGTNWAAYKVAFDAVAVDRAAGALTLNSAKMGGRRR